MKYLVLLAGCGLGDGSCIEEVILTYAALENMGVITLLSQKMFPFSLLTT